MVERSCPAGRRRGGPCRPCTGRAADRFHADASPSRRRDGAAPSAGGPDRTGVLLWNLALDRKYGPHKGGCADCPGVVTIDSATGAVTRNVEYYALGHASRFVRPGARRIQSSSGVAGVETVAFRNADDGSKALVALNTAAAPRALVVRTGGRSFGYTLPAGAVATFRWD
jgi:O-glycosyl hydrolase